MMLHDIVGWIEYIASLSYSSSSPWSASLLVRSTHSTWASSLPLQRLLFFWKDHCKVDRIHEWINYFSFRLIDGWMIKVARPADRWWPHPFLLMGWAGLSILLLCIHGPDQPKLCVSSYYSHPIRLFSLVGIIWHGVLSWLVRERTGRRQGCVSFFPGTFGAQKDVIHENDHAARSRASSALISKNYPFSAWSSKLLLPIQFLLLKSFW